MRWFTLATLSDTTNPLLNCAWEDEQLNSEIEDPWPINL